MTYTEKFNKIVLRLSKKSRKECEQEIEEILGFCQTIDESFNSAMDRVFPGCICADKSKKFKPAKMTMNDENQPVVIWPSIVEDLKGQKK